MTQENNSRAVTVAEQAHAATAIATTDMDMAKTLVASGFFPTIKSASQALVKIQLGKELGFGPVSSMMGVHVWSDKQGRTTVQLGANLIANLIRKSGIYDFRVKTLTDEACEVEFSAYRNRQTQVIGVSKFTIKDAQRAGLAQKDVWRSYPRNMLFAATVRNGAKWFCSEVLLGAAIPLSANEPAESETTGAEDAYDGHTIEGAIVDRGTGEIMEPEVPVVSEPPEGYQPNWSAFWRYTKEELGLTQEQVHICFDVDPKPGALKAYADHRSECEDKTLAQVVGEMTEEVATFAETLTVEYYDSATDEVKRVASHKAPDPRQVPKGFEDPEPKQAGLEGLDPLKVLPEEMGL